MALNKNDVQIIIVIVSAIIKYGKPMISKFLDRLEKDTITLEDLEKMKIDIEPEEYFPTYKEKLEKEE